MGGPWNPFAYTAGMAPRSARAPGCPRHVTMPEIAFTQVAGPELVATARALFREYADAIGTDLEYQGFAAELAALPAPYVPPRGALLIAHAGGDVAGCVGLRPLDADTAEMKRLYVRPAYRQVGLGRRLVDVVIRAARERGYRELRLDTLASMTAAQALYRRMGFVEIAPYGGYHLPGTRFFALALDAPAARVRRFDAVEWPLYRALRLDALRDAPDAFGSTIEREAAFPDHEWIARLARGTASPLECPLVAERDGHAIGLAWARLDPDDRRVAALYQVWVDPSARTHGVGRALLDAALTWARDAGAQVIRLAVALGPASARGFYERAGFVPVGLPTPLRPGSTLLQQEMQRTLTNRPGDDARPR